MTETPRYWAAIKSWAKLTSTIMLAFLLLNPCWAGQVQPSSIKLYGQVDEVHYACKAAGLTLSSTHLPATINRVRLGSPAFYEGVSDGDKLLTARIDNDKLYLTASRNGKIYGAVLRTSPVDLEKEKAKEDAEKTALLKGGAKSDPLPEMTIVPKDIPEVEITPEARLKELAGYQIVLVVDRSGSMQFPLQSFPETKWQWAQAQIGGLAQKLKPHLDRRGIDLISFSETYNVERGCTPEHVMNFFHDTIPNGGTDMGSPLETVFHDYLATPHDRPLLIAVMTDGMPNRGPDVKEVIIEATRGMQAANEIRLVFLEIGEEFDGWSTIKGWDDNLVASGARYDIIDSVEFSELARRGLADELVEVIKRNDGKNPAPHK